MFATDSRTRHTRGTPRGATDCHTEVGATLLLALIFLFAVSLVVVAVVRWTGNDLSNTAAFRLAQTTQSEADSGTLVAIQFVRFNFLSSSLDGAPPASCWNSTVSMTDANDPTGQHAVNSWCMTRWYIGASTGTRVVTISTCAASVPAGLCAEQPLLQAIVTITDGIAACGPLANASAAPNTCGEKLSISDWQFAPAPPTITGFPTPNFTCSTGTPVEIAGTNLLNATNVDFLLPSSVGSTQPVGSPASSFSVVTNAGVTTIDACTPTEPSSTSYYVLVSTPMGSNQLIAPPGQAGFFVPQWTSG